MKQSLPTPLKIDIDIDTPCPVTETGIVANFRLVLERPACPGALSHDYHVQLRRQHRRAIRNDEDGTLYIKQSLTPKDRLAALGEALASAPRVAAT